MLSVIIDSHKDILSITIGANETSKFWLGMLNVLVFSVDGLARFKEAI